MNPFRARGVVTGEHFADRAEEVRRIARVWEEPGAKLLVYGPRRMGKTSAIVTAARRAERAGRVVVRADLSTASSSADAANRLLQSAATALGRKWKAVVSDLAGRIGVRLTLAADASGVLQPALDVGLRAAPESEQREALGAVLDAIDGLAGDRGAGVGIVLDEFQEIHRFGGEEAEWHLRGHIQLHENVSYVLAGSETSLIRAMLGQDRAFYQLFDLLHLEPIDSEFFARWIDDRLPGRAGERIVGLCGPRPMDIVQLARKAHDLAGGGAATEDVLRRAYLEILEEEDDFMRAAWDRLTPLQQNVLRAIAAGVDGLTTADTLARFALPSTGSATNAARALVDQFLLIRREAPPAYGFDSPFFRGWVALHALPDAGIVADPLRVRG